VTFAYTAGHAFDRAKPSMVFVHGAGLDHSWFGLQSRYFGYHGWNVFAFDLPGHGRSGGSPISSIKGMAEWVCKEVPAEKFSIVGHSMGSLIALECAARVPSRIERIAMIGVAYPMKVGEAFLEAAKRDSYDAFDMSTIWGHAAQVPLAGNPNPGMWMYGDMLARLERLAPGVLHAGLKACNDYAAGFESAARVKCPVLFILGRRDVMTPPRSAQALRDKFSDGRTVDIPLSGHSLMVEAPDDVLDALIAFIS